MCYTPAFLGIMVDCYVALGGNLAGTLKTMRRVALRLERMEEIEELTFSRLYETSPVGVLEVGSYLNAVCRFQTKLAVKKLWELLQRLECEMGKVAKRREDPRLIDLDLLFYGAMSVNQADLIVPHPRWQERLFVLAPLADVTDRAPIGLEMKTILDQFCNPHQEMVLVRSEKLSDGSCAS
jgi:2-amino-4-hydroxy-6-hydroxymethyldihydropteridine diphosphokinase